ncbi:MAG: outer membrane protein assembly factor BamD, partial [Rickettsiales bacterium]|nr:outer membrane protein assembly factor BamD [Rickettsiales bacterium]
MKKFLCLIFAALLVSCSGKDTTQVPSEKLYRNAMEKFKYNRLEEAINGFEKLDTRYDFEKYHEAMIMIAYANYAMGNYDEALLKIDSIKDLNLKDLEYVYYLQILSYYGKIFESKKDLSILKELFACTNNMLKKFPDSVYIDDVLVKRKIVFEYIVESELNIAKYYIEDNNLIGALNHLKYLLDNYPENKYSAEIFYLMCKIYSHIEYADGYDV